MMPGTEQPRSSKRAAGDAAEPDRWALSEIRARRDPSVKSLGPRRAQTRHGVERGCASSVSQTGEDVECGTHCRARVQYARDCTQDDQPDGQAGTAGSSQALTVFTATWTLTSYRDHEV